MLLSCEAESESADRGRRKVPIRLGSDRLVWHHPPSIIEEETEAQRGALAYLQLAFPRGLFWKIHLLLIWVEMANFGRSWSGQREVLWVGSSVWN